MSCGGIGNGKGVYMCGMKYMENLHLPINFSMKKI